ncbi:MAG TPA: hypothetical protein PK822_07505 [Bacillota bacterium]|nr:hypothetical protein [Bacillota bacterium]
MDYAAKPFGLGQTYFGRTPTADEQAKVSMLEGYEAIFSDTVQEGARLTNRRRRAVLVRNDSGALSPGTVVNWKNGYVGKRVGGKTGAGIQAVAGVVDPELNADVANGDLFWLIKEGPVTVTAAGKINSNAMITNAAAGKVQSIPTSPASATEAQSNAVMMIGLAMSSASADGDTLRAYVRFPF